MVANTERLRSSQVDLFARLRSCTSPAHRELDNRLELLKAPVSFERFNRCLKRFAGFHMCWEPALAALPMYAPLSLARRRLPLLRRDLECLGTASTEFDSLPRCEAAADLVSNAARAMGSLYVMEGSTLGGAVIGRALAGATWLPEGGLYYFSPPRRDVYSDWCELKAWAAHTWPPAHWSAIEDGARETFSLLTAWMAGGPHE